MSSSNGCARPKRFVGNDKGNQILVQRMRLVTHDAGGPPVGRRVSPGENFTIAADMVIKALGFDAEDLPVMFNTPELQLSPRGTLAVDQKSFMTSLPNVFAAGDIVRGASLVVWAIRDGRDAADAMHRHLTQQVERESRMRVLVCAYRLQVFAFSPPALSPMNNRACVTTRSRLNKR